VYHDGLPERSRLPRPPVGEDARGKKEESEEEEEKEGKELA